MGAQSQHCLLSHLRLRPSEYRQVLLIVANDQPVTVENEWSADQRRLDDHLMQELLVIHRVDRRLSLSIDARPLRQNVHRMNARSVEDRVELICGQSIAKEIASFVVEMRSAEELLSLLATCSGRVDEGTDGHLASPSVYVRSSAHCIIDSWPYGMAEDA